MDSNHRAAHVIGMGEVGSRLSRALSTSGWSVQPVTRTAGWEQATDPKVPSLRIVAVREEALEGVLEKLAPLPRNRLVLVQNGFLEAVHGDLGNVTRGLIYFTSKGDFYRELCPSPFYGPTAPDLVDALGGGGIACELISDPDAATREMIVKGVWNAVVGLPLAVREVDLATYCESFREELEALVRESAGAASAEYGVTVSTDATLRKILDTTTELGWVRGGAKALPWRNGAIAKFGRRHGIATPVNDELLSAVGYE